MSAGPDSPAVTPVVIRLKLSLLRNGLRQSGGRRAAYVVSAIVALLFAALQLLGLIALRGHAHADAVAVIATAALALGWTVMPLFAPGGDETLDPTRLVMLPLRPRPLVRALLAASLVGIGPLFTLLLLTGCAVSVAHGPAASVTAVVAVAVALLACVALARAVAAANVRLLNSRKGRDLAVLSGLAIAIGAQLVNFAVQRLGSASALTQLAPAADVVRWVPPASAVGAVQSVSDGSYGVAAAQLALSAVFLALALTVWSRTLTRLMTSPDASTLQAAEPASRGRGRGPADRSGAARLLPSGRTGTVMERSLRYVWRDPKTKGAWGAALAIGLIVPVFNALRDTGSVYFSCFAAGMIGMQMYNQYGQDGSAFWMVAATVASPRDAYVELRGRAFALLLVILPYAVLVTSLTAGLLGDWPKLPEVLGLSFALLGAMLATGAWASALFPYSIPQDSHRNVAAGQQGLAWISVFGGMAAAAVLCSPVIALTIWLNVTGSPWTWLLLPVGTAYGALVAWLSLRLAAPRTASRLPEILAAVSKG
ncbi:transporter [Streptomyces sp. NPDC047000]|uniref:transporter n=1 Tax=Streptomyces sp. NPDC047000 TaxID=3155474 RepID=UPI003404FCA2